MLVWGSPVREGGMMDGGEGDESGDKMGGYSLEGTER